MGDDDLTNDGVGGDRRALSPTSHGPAVANEVGGNGSGAVLGQLRGATINSVATTVSWIRALHRPLSILEAGMLVLAVLGPMMLPISPIGCGRVAVSGGIVCLLAAWLVSRRLWLIIPSGLMLSVVSRMAFEGSWWSDQHFYQVFSVSSLLSGHGIYSIDNLIGTTWANYLPMGSLFGGIVQLAGVSRYWSFFHLLIPFLLVIPVLAIATSRTVAAFLVVSLFFPLVDYTSGGGTIELGYALLIPGLFLLLVRRHVECGAVMVAFAAMNRPDDLVLIPFVLLLLVRDRDRRPLAVFVGGLIVFGGIYILRNPIGFTTETLGRYELWAEIVFNRMGSLGSNFSVSSVLQWAGLSESTVWHDLGWLYPGLRACALAGLAVVAIRCRTRAGVIGVALLAPVSVLVFSRGYVQFHYLVGAFMPYLALVSAAPEAVRESTSATRSGVSVLDVRSWLSWEGVDSGGTGSMPISDHLGLRVVVWGCTAVLIAIGGTAMALFVMSPRTDVDQLRSVKTIPIQSTRVIRDGALVRHGRRLDPSRTERIAVAVGEALEIELAVPAKVRSVVLEGPAFTTVVIDGVPMPHCFSDQTYAFPTKGHVEVSNDGVHFTAPVDFVNHVHFSVFPIELAIPPTDGPVRAIRISIDECFMASDRALIGNILVRPEMDAAGTG